MQPSPCETCSSPCCGEASRTTLPAGSVAPSYSIPFAHHHTLATPRVEFGNVHNPVVDADFADPGVLKVGDVYYAYATNAGGKHVPVARSRDILHWKLLRDALPVLPPWADKKFGRTHAPAVALTPEGYVMYFSTRCHRASRAQAIGVAMSAAPAGPFEPFGDRPLICQGELGGSDDPSPFIDENGDRYLLWKNNPSSPGMQTFIYIQRISIDGLTLLGDPLPVIANDQSWEGPFVGSPTLAKYHGKYYLFYSANGITNARFAIGCATADHVLGPYRKSRTPLFATDRRRGVIGPGGQDIARGPGGSTLFFFHAWSPKGFRALNVARLTWQEQSRPATDPSGHMR